MTIKLAPDHKGGEAGFSTICGKYFVITDNVVQKTEHDTREAAAEAWNAGAKELVPLSENLQRLNNKLFVAMNSIASGYGHTRNGVTKSEYLAVNILTEIAKEANK